METRGTGARGLRVRAGACGRPAVFEPLEARQLLTAYLGQSLADYFHLPGVLLDNIAPPSGAVYADFGASAAGLGDLDGDGYGDFAISAPGTTNPDGSTGVAGAVFIFSGKNGSLIRTLDDGFAGFGTSIANIGDINGDGKADLAVGSANFDPAGASGTDHVGRAYVYSGVDGAALLTLDGTGAGDEFGFVVVGGGDVNADGTNDLVVGAPGAGTNSEGRVYVFSGVDGAPLQAFSGEGAGDRFGGAVFTSASVINPPAGSTPIVWVGAPLNDSAGTDAGRVYAFNAVTGAEIWHRDGFVAGDRFGTALAALPSSRGTGPYTLLLVGVPGAGVLDQQSQTLAGAGKLSGLDGATGEVNVFTFPAGTVAGQHLGSGLWLAGPTDVLIWSPGRTSDQFTVYQKDTNFMAIFGAGRVFDLGDLDGDGYFDVATQPEGGVGVTVRSTLTASVPGAVTSSNQAFSFVYFNSDAGEGSAIVNGRYLRYSQIPGLHADDNILGVNDSHLIVGGVRGAGPAYVAFVVREGIRAAFGDAVTSVNAPPGIVPDYAGFTLVRVTNDGSILLTETGPRAWLFRDGALTYLWNGGAADINNSGVILGGISGRGTVLRFPDGSLVDVAATRFQPYRLNDADTVAGVYYDGAARWDVALWHDGALTLITSSLTDLPNDSPRPGIGSWNITALQGGDGWVFDWSHLNGLFGERDLFIYDPHVGLHDLGDVTFGHFEHGLSQPPTTELVLSQDGRILLSTGVVTPTDDLGLWGAGAGAPLGSDAGVGPYIVSVNVRGDGILTTRTQDGWTGARIDGMTFTLDGALPTRILQTIAYTDPTLHTPGLFVVTTGGIYQVVRSRSWGQWQVITDPIPIVDHASLFVSADRRACLTGVSAEGDLLLYYQTGITSPAWATSNLTTDHVQAGGQTFVPVAGSLTGFATAWGGMNIAYLGASGQVQTVWWAPGLARWRTDSLSESAGYTGTLHGTLVSYVTPWGGLNVAGTDASGNLVALWWAPGMAHWRTDRLVDGTPAQLDENTLTAFVTPWGGLNVVGLDKSTGKLTAYWWVPRKPAWVVEEFTIAAAPADLSLTGRLSSAVSAGGDVFIAAVTADHHLANIWFGAANSYLWTFEDVTVAV